MEEASGADIDRISLLSGRREKLWLSRLQRLTATIKLLKPAEASVRTLSNLEREIIDKFHSYTVLFGAAVYKSVLSLKVIENILFNIFE